MANKTLKLEVSLPESTALKLAEFADGQRLSLNEYVAHVLRRSVTGRWPDIAEAADQQAQLAEIAGERDRARDSAALHEADAHSVREQLIEMVGTGEIVVAPGFFAKIGCEVPSTYMAKGSKR